MKICVLCERPVVEEERKLHFDMYHKNTVRRHPELKGRTVKEIMRIRKLLLIFLFCSVCFAQAEIVSKREYSSKTFDNGDGTLTGKFYGSHIHYKDTLGDMQDVDLNFEDKGTYWQVKSASYKLYVNKNFQNDELVRFDNKYEGNSHSFYYEPHSLWWVNKFDTDDRTKIIGAQDVDGTCSGNEITFEDAFGTDIDFVVRAERNGFVKAIKYVTEPSLSPPSNDYKYVLVSKFIKNSAVTIKANNNETDWDEETEYGSQDGFEIKESVNLKSYIKEAYIWDSSTDINKQKLTVYWEKKNGNLWQAKVLPKNYFASAVYPVFADTTNSYYVGGGEDGLARGLDADWDTAHDEAGDLNDSANNRIFTASWANKTIYRCLVPIDTSSIPDNATISAATFYLYCSSSSIGDDDGDDVAGLVKTYQTSYTALQNDDYEDVGSDGDVAGTAMNTPIVLLSNTEIDISTTGATTWYSWALNATGLSAISKTSYTPLGVREGHDYRDSAITASTENDCRFNDSEDGSNNPYLSVTYTAPMGREIGRGIGWGFWK